MNLGLLTSILPGYSFEEVVSFASGMGFRCLEVACWPKSKAERRYSGITHIDIDSLNEKTIGHIQTVLETYKMKISALCYYPNPLDSDPDKAQASIDHICKLIKAAPLLGIDVVNTFIGRDKNKDIEDNLKLAQATWQPILALAEQEQVKIGIENCPMFFTKDEWPGGNNLFSTPYIWKKLFELLPSDHLGINYDPSHIYLQGMDYLRPIYDFSHKLFHVHIKDLKVYPDKVNEYGMFSYPLNYMSPKIPGQGGIHWGKFISALHDVRYSGAVCLEIEDKAYEDSEESILTAIQLSNNHLRQYIL